MSDKESNEWLRELVQEAIDKPKVPWSVGDRYRDPKNRILEVRAIVDDQVVFRCWSKEKDDWVYYIQPLLYSEPQHGYMLKIGKKLANA